jgi:hypothetical protein
VAVGADGAITRFNGTNWTGESSGVTETLTAVWGDADDNYWVVGWNAVILHYNGTEWQRIPIGFSDDVGFEAVWGSGGNDVWIGGDNEYLMHHEIIQ